MKEQLSKGLIDTDQTARSDRPDDRPDDGQLIPEWALKWGGLVIGVGIGILFFKFWSKSQPDYFLEMDTVTGAVADAVAEPKPEPEPDIDITMD